MYTSYSKAEGYLWLRYLPCEDMYLSWGNIIKLRIGFLKLRKPEVFPERYRNIPA